MSTSPATSSSAVSSHHVLSPTLPTLECACGRDTASFRCIQGANKGKEFIRCRQQICYTWIWEEQLNKYVESMVKHKTAAQISSLREALEACTSQLAAKDEQIAVLRAEIVSLKVNSQHADISAKFEIASMKGKFVEASSSRNTFKMFFGLLFLVCVRVSAVNTI